MARLGRGIRLSGDSGAAKLECEDVTAQPPFVLSVIDYLPAADMVEFETARDMVLLPACGSMLRIAKVAAYLGWLAGLPLARRYTSR